MKGKEEHSIDTEHEEQNFCLESSKGDMLGNSGNDNNISSTSSVPFKVEVNLEIPIFNGQTNDEALYSWLKQLEVYFGLYKIQETQQISFSHLNMTIHALLWWKIYLDAMRIGKNPKVMK